MIRQLPNLQHTAKHPITHTQLCHHCCGKTEKSDLVRHLGILKEGIRFYLKKIFPTLRLGKIITLQGVRTLNSSKMEDLKMEKINEGITNLAEMDIMSIIIIISLVIYILPLESGLITVPSMKK